MKSFIFTSLFIMATQAFATEVPNSVLENIADAQKIFSKINVNEANPKAAFAGKTSDGHDCKLVFGSHQITSGTYVVARYYVSLSATGTQSGAVNVSTPAYEDDGDYVARKNLLGNYFFSHTEYKKYSKECNIFCTGTDGVSRTKSWIEIKTNKDGVPTSAEGKDSKYAVEVSYPIAIPVGGGSKEYVHCENLKPVESQQ